MAVFEQKIETRLVSMSNTIEVVSNVVHVLHVSFLGRSVTVTKPHLYQTAGIHSRDLSQRNLWPLN